MSDPITSTRAYDAEKLRGELDRVEGLIREVTPEAPDIGALSLQATAAPPEAAKGGDSVMEPPQVAQPKPQRRKREFAGRVAQMRKNAQRGALPTTEELESIILAVALRTVNNADPKRAAVGMDLLLQVYNKRTTAKHAPGNTPKKRQAADEQV